MFMDVKIERRIMKGTRIVSAISWVWGLCSGKVPDFELHVSLRLKDWANLTGLCPAVGLPILLPNGAPEYQEASSSLRAQSFQWLFSWMTDSLLSFNLTPNIQNYYTLKCMQTLCKNDYGEIECKSHVNIIQSSFHKIVYVNNSKGF